MSDVRQAHAPDPPVATSIPERGRFNRRRGSEAGVGVGRRTIRPEAIRDGEVYSTVPERWARHTRLGTAGSGAREHDTARACTARGGGRARQQQRFYAVNCHNPDRAFDGGADIARSTKFAEPAPSLPDPWVLTLSAPGHPPATF